MRDAYLNSNDLWQRQRHWYTPRPHRLLTSALPVASTPHALRGARYVQFAVLLKQAAAAYLWQHRVSGRPLLPGAAMIETCFAAACTLTRKASRLCLNEHLKWREVSCTDDMVSCITCTFCNWSAGDAPVPCLLY